MGYRFKAICKNRFQLRAGIEPGTTPSISFEAGDTRMGFTSLNLDNLFLKLKMCCLNIYMYKYICVYCIRQKN